MKTFWTDHFDHLLLTVLGVGSAVGGVFCDHYHLDTASKWLFGQGTGFLSALLLRMRGPGAGPNA